MPVVTEILPARNSAQRRRIYLDEKFAFVCHLNVVARFRLRQGLVLSAEQVEAIRQGDIRQDCFDRAMRHLSQRLHSRMELRTKLMRHQFPHDIIAGVLDDLQRMNYLDDERFAQEKARFSMERKHNGRRKTRIDLLKAGVQQADAENALAQVYAGSASLDAARALAERHAPRLRKLDLQVGRRRLFGLLQRRGFSYDEAKPLIAEFLGRADDD